MVSVSVRASKRRAVTMRAVFVLDVLILSVLVQNSLSHPRPHSSVFGITDWSFTHPRPEYETSIRYLFFEGKEIA